MNKISIANLKKTVYYLQRNGLRDTYLAALEGLRENGDQGSQMQVREPELTGEILEGQRQHRWTRRVKFSVLVPAYSTPEEFLRAMIESVLEQTYGELELILADASPDDQVKKVAESYLDPRLIYVALEKNDGIAENTNRALERATGDYVALLDHDDVLSPNALYEMAMALENRYLTGRETPIIYSDEDKCDQQGSSFFEPHRKPDFNLDLLLSNNYICHFLAVETCLARRTGFRREFDGAQDYDFVLRCVSSLIRQEGSLKVVCEKVVHIPRILYHWRCHGGSTAVNPGSKMYAYEAGGRAVDSFLAEQGWMAKAVPLKHLGFYRVDYDRLFQDRPEVGALGGPVWGRNKKMSGGLYDEKGNCPYQGLRRGFGGYMHRAKLQQEIYAADLRNMVLRPQLWETYEEVVGIPYTRQRELSDGSSSCSHEEMIQLSLRLAEKIHEKGYRVLWDPKL